MRVSRSGGVRCLPVRAVRNKLAISPRLHGSQPYSPDWPGRPLSDSRRRWVALTPMARSSQDEELSFSEATPTLCAVQLGSAPTNRRRHP